MVAANGSVFTVGGYDGDTVGRPTVVADVAVGHLEGADLGRPKPGE